MRGSAHVDAVTASRPRPGWARGARRRARKRSNRRGGSVWGAEQQLALLHDRRASLQSLVEVLVRLRHYPFQAIPTTSPATASAGTIRAARADTTADCRDCPKHDTQDGGKWQQHTDCLQPKLTMLWTSTRTAPQSGRLQSNRGDHGGRCSSSEPDPHRRAPRKGSTRRRAGAGAVHSPHKRTGGGWAS